MKTILLLLFFILGIESSLAESANEIDSIYLALSTITEGAASYGVAPSVVINKKIQKIFRK